MGLQPGQGWGEIEPTPPDLVCVQGDRELAAALSAPHSSPLQVTSGDLARTIGSHRPRHPEAPWRRVPIDQIEVTTEHGTITAVAHVILRRSWWRGPVVAICNSEYLGTWDIAPRAHPGDGLIDVVEVAASMSARARFQAWRRVPTGTHLPHPDLRSRQVESASWEFPRPVRVIVDGHRWVRARQITVKVLAGEAHLWI
jgi:hypothetical protein